MDDIFESLKNIGLNGYEAKIYFALLKKHPATGYELSKIANIPQARAYDTLKALEKERIVVSSNTKPITYLPIKPQELLKRYKRKMNSTLDYLEKTLPQVKENYTEPLVTITGRSAIYEKVIELINSAQHDIYIEIWAQDFKAFENALQNAYNRGVEVKIVGYDGLRCNFGTVFEHESAKEIEISLSGRLIILAIDNDEGVIGNLSSLSNDILNIMTTKNKSIVFLIKEFIIHDMYTIDVKENLSEQLKIVYGKGFKALRDRVLGSHSLYRLH